MASGDKRNEVVMSQRAYFERFTEICEELVATTTAKNKDYAGIKDAFKNFKQTEQFGVATAEAGIFTRMTDKITRIANLLQRPASVRGEAITDTLTDLAVYSIILRMYLETKDANA